MQTAALVSAENLKTKIYRCIAWHVRYVCCYGCIMRRICARTGNKNKERRADKNNRYFSYTVCVIHAYSWSAQNDERERMVWSNEAAPAALGRYRLLLLLRPGNAVNLDLPRCTAHLASDYVYLVCIITLWLSTVFAAFYARTWV